AEEIERLYTEEALKLLSEYPGTWCSILGEGPTKAPQAKKEVEEQTTPTQSLVPALLVRGHAAKR
ncbi:MAG: hypothetical protein MN733_09070, partial [Nitrososphaera sp.]|nr:hypothetical protein [Nitrososphaera sp.]